MKSKCFRYFLSIVQIRLFVVLAFVCINDLSALAADPSTFSGEWMSRSIEGVGSPNNDPGCQILGWTERKIKLEQIPGNPKRFQGEWVRKYQGLWIGVHGE